MGGEGSIRVGRERFNSSLIAKLFGTSVEMVSAAHLTSSFAGHTPEDSKARQHALMHLLMWIADELQRTRPHFVET